MTSHALDRRDRIVSRGMVSESPTHGDASAINGGLIASRVIAAGLRARAVTAGGLQAKTGQLTPSDIDALEMLVGYLASEGRSATSAAHDFERYAFASVTHAAAPLEEDLGSDLETVRQDAQTLIKWATHKRRPSAAAVSDAAQRLVERFIAVSEFALAQAGRPGDSLGGRKA
jgi:hypothetical protein